MMESNALYVKYEFDGFVTKIKTGNFGTDIICQTMEDDFGIKFPQHLMFSVSQKKSGEIPDGLSEGDKVHVEFMPILIEGVTKMNKAYYINKLYIQKMSITAKSTKPPEDSSKEEELPF